MTNFDELTPWEQQEVLDELLKRSASRFPDRSESGWVRDDPSSPVLPLSAPYPPPYDPGPKAEPDEQHDLLARRPP